MATFIGSDVVLWPQLTLELSRKNISMNICRKWRWVKDPLESFHMSEHDTIWRRGYNAMKMSPGVSHRWCFLYLLLIFQCPISLVVYAVSSHDWPLITIAWQRLFWVEVNFSTQFHCIEWHSLGLSKWKHTSFPCLKGISSLLNVLETTATYKSLLLLLHLI